MFPVNFVTYVPGCTADLPNPLDEPLQDHHHRLAEDLLDEA
jgi:hypothetical protein